MTKLTAKARFALLPWITHQDGCDNLNGCECGLNEAMRRVDQMTEDPEQQDMAERIKELEAAVDGKGLTHTICIAPNVVVYGDEEAAAVLQDYLRIFDRMRGLPERSVSEAEIKHYTYQFKLSYSEEDECYIATVPEFRGVIAHGLTPVAALKEAEISLDTAIEVYEVCGWDLPRPIHR